MIRALIFFALVLLAAYGASWMADHPGTVAINFGGQAIQFSTLVAVVVVLAAAALLIFGWTALRFVFAIPSLMTMASAARRRQRGYAALSRGMVAVGSGDAETARRSATEASRLLRGEPMALLLKAQAAQLTGNREEAEQTFASMLDHPDTRALALRGLYMEAQRRGDSVAAIQHAEQAHRIATLPWAATALLQARAGMGEWRDALRLVERNVGARVTDRLAGNRQKAVLLTGLAESTINTNPEEALAAVKEAVKLAPTLVPAASLAARLLSRKGDYKRATRIIETAYAETPHPDLADVYLHIRQGDSAADRLARAETLSRCAHEATETRIMLARAALDAREFVRARAEMAPLLMEEAGRPTRRTCLTMAEIEETEHGETGALFEWLQRASRGVRDPAWIADGVVSETWAPVSPISGRLDAFVWETPKDQLFVDHDASIVQRRARPKPDAIGHDPAPENEKEAAPDLAPAVL